MPETSAPVSVSTIELFFDLVFVFTITQVTAVAAHSPGTTGILHAALELSIIYWMYGAYAWLTNTREPDTLARRGILLAAMAAFLVLSLAVPTAFGVGAKTFAFAYVAVVALHAAGYLVFSGWGVRAAIGRLALGNGSSAGLLVAAAFAPRDLVLTLWVLAVVIEYATPFVVRLRQSFAINAAHFGERHGLVILIVLGESLAGVALAGEQSEFRAVSALGALAGLTVLAALWWLYFGGDDERAVRAMEKAEPHQRVWWALRGYFVAHYVMIFGVLLLAAGVRQSDDDLLVAAGRPGAWMMAAGVAIFVVGSGLFRWTLHFADPLRRLLTAIVCFGLAPIGMATSTAVELVAGAVVIGALLILFPDRSFDA